MLSCEHQGRTIIAGLEDPDWLRIISRKNEFKCPVCQSVVHFRQGTYHPHFYHIRISTCNYKSESEEHEIGKLFIFNLLNTKFDKKHVFLEEKVESGQLSDVLLVLEDGKFAFEIQFSSQTDAIWKERTIKYEELGIKPVWILGYKESIEDLLVSGNFYDSEICEDARINLGLTKSNAGIRINDLPQDSYFLRKNYLSEYQNRQIFHILTVVKGNCKLYLGYLRPTSKTKFYGTVIQLGELWKFSSKYVRFLPSIEILFNDKEKLKHQHIEAQTDLRKELHDKILEYTKCTSLYEIPEIAAQTMGNSPYKLKVFSIEYKINSVKDRLLAEIAIYEKFVKRKQKGDSFTFTKEVYEFLEKWGFITEENKQSLKPQMGNFLNNLRSLGILEKQGDSKIWIVTGKKLLDM